MLIFYLHTLRQLNLWYYGQVCWFLCQNDYNNHNHYNDYDFYNGYNDYSTNLILFPNVFLWNETMIQWTQISFPLGALGKIYALGCRSININFYRPSCQFKFSKWDIVLKLHCALFIYKIIWFIKDTKENNRNIRTNSCKRIYIEEWIPKFPYSVRE